VQSVRLEAQWGNVAVHDVGGKCPGEIYDQALQLVESQKAQNLDHTGIRGSVSDLYLYIQSEPKLIPIDEQPEDDVMHLNRFGKTDRLAG
jgi:hypothetical protein